MFRLLLTSALLCCVLFAGCNDNRSPHMPDAAYSAAATADFEDINSAEQVLTLHNIIRKENGLPMLRRNRELDLAAAWHAINMANRNVLAHNLDGQTVGGRVKSAKYDFIVVGENIAFGQTSAIQVMEEWMNSRGHRLNILGDYYDIGIGLGRSDDGRLYWCVVFATR